MDLRFSPELEDWRSEVRAFLEKECPPGKAFDVHYEEEDEKWEFGFEFNRRVGEKGWIGVNWPVEYGGMGKPHIYRSIMMLEFDRYNAPLINSIGWGLAAGLLLKFGSEEEKKRFLPSIIKQETFWAEGLSEPDAGSDLAALETRAVRDGDDWVINGQKTYTSYAHRADVLYLAARTDPDAPRHRGISIFCMDLKLPGVSLVPMHNMEGGMQNHTFLDNVRIPGDMLLGEPGMGWQYIMNSFYGGGGGGGDGEMTRVFEALIAYSKETYRNGKLLSKDPIVRQKLADLAITLETLKMIGWDGLYRTEYGVPPEMGGALGVVVSKEFWPRIGQTCMEILGPLGQIQTGKWAPLAGHVEQMFRRSFRDHAGGTSQVKRMVLATRGLGLPR